MRVEPIRTRIFKERDDLTAFIRAHIPELADGSVLVVTSKVVALAEGRTAPAKDKKRVIRAESERMLKTRYVYLTLKDGNILANAGIDESNAQGKLVLLPRDAYASAAALRKELIRAYDVKRLGIIITDSRVLPLRAGVVGVALGYAGMKGLRDYRGKKDLFGRPFVFATASVADMLASAAVVVMGEGRECSPLAVIEGAPVSFASRVDRRELAISVKDDMYVPFYGRMLEKKEPKKRKMRPRKSS